MLSWATTSLLQDGTGLGDLVQGVTLEVFGEGVSMGPLNDDLLARFERDRIYDYEIDWRSLGEYLERMECSGLATNVASYVGATTVRTNVLGFEDRAATEQELDQMRGLVRDAMEQGALGVGSSLIYPPAFFASTEELIELNKVAAKYGGGYISHMRSEGDRLLEGVEELIKISREAGVRAEIYHLKAAGQKNWSKLDAAIAMIEGARAEGLEITADMYLYTAGATGLSASMPPWVQEGGHEAMVERLQDPLVRQRVEQEMRTASDSWENLLLASGNAERVLLVGFRNDALRNLVGRTLGSVAEERGVSPEAAVIDLILEDDTRVEAIYFMMSEENVRKQIALPFMRFGSDAGSMAPRPPFTDYSTHPRAYGNVARLLGKYVRDEKVITLAEAIKRLTSLPAETLRIRDRGSIEEGFYADLVVFSPDEIQDNATYEKPHQLASGMKHVVINGEVVLSRGEPTEARPGRALRGPGWLGWERLAEGESAPGLVCAKP